MASGCFEVRGTGIPSPAPDQVLEDFRSCKTIMVIDAAFVERVARNWSLLFSTSPSNPSALKPSNTTSESE
jgi:hypothetical protein